MNQAAYLYWRRLLLVLAAAAGCGFMGVFGFYLYAGIHPLLTFLYVVAWLISTAVVWQEASRG